jgi:uncharacterized Rmd1/YagE family protein
MRCSSYCTAEKYDIVKLTANLNHEGLEPQYFDDVIHVQKEVSKKDPKIDIFLFPFGCAIIWGGDEIQEKIILDSLKPFSINPHEIDVLDLIYFQHDSTVEKTFINEEENKIIFYEESPLVKISLSHAFAQSVKLEILEKSVTNLLEKTNPIQMELAKTGGVSLSN